MVQVISTVTIRIPKSKGKINGKVVSKRSYVYYFVNTLLENALEPTPKSEIHALSERITDLVLRKAKALDTVRVFVSVKYSGYVRIAGKVVGNYDFTLTIRIENKVISVYEIRRNFDDRLFDVRFRVPKKDNDFGDFAGIANFAVNHGLVMPIFEVDNDFTAIVNYVTEYVKAYGKKYKRKVDVYAYADTIREFFTFLNTYVDVFNDKDLRELISKRYVYYWYRYLRNSGYFIIYHGDIE